MNLEDVLKSTTYFFANLKAQHIILLGIKSNSNKIHAILILAQSKWAQNIKQNNLDIKYPIILTQFFEVIFQITQILVDVPLSTYNLVIAVQNIDRLKQQKPYIDNRNYRYMNDSQLLIINQLRIVCKTKDI
ncbi:hypothetical protein ABPG74_017949 [Tetrahymena malaccensis]